MRPRYLSVFLWSLGLFASAVMILSGTGADKFLHLHLGLDMSNGILSMLLAVFLMGERHAIQANVRNYLVIGFGFAAGTELLHALVGIEWTGWFAWIDVYSGLLRPATWPPSTYVLPLAMAWALWLIQRNSDMPPLKFAAGMALLTVVLTALSFVLPQYVEGSRFGIVRPTQVPLLLLWLVVIAAYWKRRRDHRIFEGFALMGVMLFLSDLCMLFSTSPHEKYTMMAHVGKFIAYAMLHVIQMRVAAEDSQARNEAEAELRIASVAFDAHESMMITDAEGVIVRINRRFTENTGFSAEDVLGKTPSVLKSGRHDADFYRKMWESIKRTGSWHGEVWDKRKNGEVYPKLLTISAVVGDQGFVTHYVASHIDISKRKADEAEIHLLAFYDPLTGMPNRRLLVDRLQKALISSARSGKHGALLFIDLDDFKVINDTLGHDVGDSLLKQVALRMIACVREGDTVARLGGDEFVVLLDELAIQALEAAAQAEIIGEKILAALNQPYQLGKHECRSTPSIGVTMCSGRHREIEELMKRGDIAMYQAKNTGKNALCFFESEMQDAINLRAALEADLRKALVNNEFHLYYQVQVDSANRPIGAETLIRWIHPERGMVSPAQFIPLAEETGLILPIGLWVLETACEQIKAWQVDVLTRDLVLAVNVSARQFSQRIFVDQVQEVVRRHGIDPNLLKLELTESMLFENIESLIITMNALYETGVRFSLDDFGTGYSSLQYLKRLPLSQLKIDQSFVRDIADDTSDRAIVRTIIAMAHGLNLDVIAEGVETAQQRQLLLEKGCSHFQGYLFSKPVPIEQFAALLKTQSAVG